MLRVRGSPQTAYGRGRARAQQVQAVHQAFSHVQRLFSARTPTPQPARKPYHALRRLAAPLCLPARLGFLLTLRVNPTCAPPLLEALRLARQCGCPWDAATCWRAAAGCHLEVLQWARAHGCQWKRCC